MPGIVLTKEPASPPHVFGPHKRPVSRYCLNTARGTAVSLLAHVHADHWAVGLPGSKDNAVPTSPVLSKNSLF